MIFDGKTESLAIQQDLAKRVAAPRVLGVLGIGLDAVSKKYVQRKQIFGDAIGCTLLVNDLPIDTDQSAAQNALLEMQSAVDAIIVQMPLPAHIDRDRLLSLVDPALDVDDLTGHSNYVSPIVQAVMRAIGRTIHNDDYIVVMGRGYLVGQPIIRTISELGFTVHSFDQDSDPAEISAALAQATIVISGVGQAHMITPSMINENAILIDVGTSFVDGKLCGDFHPDCAARAAVFTPTPGGIGPMVVAYLWSNVVLTSEFPNSRS